MHIGFILDGNEVGIEWGLLELGHKKGAENVETFRACIGLDIKT